MRLHLLTAPFARLTPPRFAVAAVMLGLGIGLVPVTQAADPTPISDVILARTILSAIDADPQLKEVNLVVSVVDRVAVIGGPVPSTTAGKRAETVVRGVKGIVDVKNNCFVSEKPDPLLKAVADRLTQPPQRPQLAELPGIVPPPRTGGTSEVTPPGTANTYAALTPPVSTLPTTTPIQTEVVVQRPANLGIETTSFLDSPVGANPKGNVTPSKLTATGAPPTVSGSTFPGRPKDVLTSAEAIRKAEARYASLAVEMKNGTLVVGGKASRAADAWDFAQALRRVPGVSRVVVGEVGTK